MSQNNEFFDHQLSLIIMIFLLNLFLYPSSPDRKMGTPFSHFTNRCRIDGKNPTTVADRNRINFVDLFIQQSTIFVVDKNPGL